jgi:hypothetical protein
MAQVLEPFEVVLDPCSGISTIHFEAGAYKNSIGLGSDVVLNHLTIALAVGALKQAAFKGSPARLLLAAWDAMHLWIWTSSVDALVLDLAFGQNCFLVNALNQLLPLIFSNVPASWYPAKDTSSC